MQKWDRSLHIGGRARFRNLPPLAPIRHVAFCCRRQHEKLRVKSAGAFLPAKIVGKSRKKTYNNLHKSIIEDFFEQVARMRNIEIKAVYSDFDRARAAIRAEGGRFQGIMHQRDVYFNTRHGRLKLRCFENGTAELIAYLRPDERAARASDYELTRVAEADSMERLLAISLGVRAVVEKKRELHLIGPVRVHLDEVAHLGTFLEFEYVLRGGEEASGAAAELERLKQVFGINEADLLAHSYSDMMILRDEKTNP